MPVQLTRRLSCPSEPFRSVNYKHMVAASEESVVCVTSLDSVLVQKIAEELAQIGVLCLSSLL